MIPRKMQDSIMKSMRGIMKLTIQSISLLGMIKLSERHQYWLQLHFTSSFVLMIINQENLENQLIEHLSHKNNHKKTMKAADETPDIPSISQHALFPLHLIPWKTYLQCKIKGKL